MTIDDDPRDWVCYCVLIDFDCVPPDKKQVGQSVINWWGNYCETGDFLDVPEGSFS